MVVNEIKTTPIGPMPFVAIKIRFRTRETMPAKRMTTCCFDFTNVNNKAKDARIIIEFPVILNGST